MLLKIHPAGTPGLRQRARELTETEIRSAGVQRLVTLMQDTLRDAPGVGLAAPQVGEPLRLAVVEDRPEYHLAWTPEQLAERERTPVPFQVLCNPVLTVLEAGPLTFFEGCLSVPGFTALVPRARRVRVDALDAEGRPVRVDAAGWHARILQHEVDHLDGTLYVDRMEPRSFCTLEQHARCWKHLPSAEVQRLLQGSG